MSTEKMTMPQTSTAVDASPETQSGMWPRIFPFAGYMGFIGLSAVFVGSEAEGTFDLWSYPIKTLVVAVLLVFFWSRFQELKSPIFVNWQEALVTVGVGLGVYALWVRMDWP